MAANGEIIYNVKFKTDLGQLESSLKKISSMKLSEFQKIKPELDISSALKEFQKLQDEANQVRNALQKAMNPQLGVTSASKLASELKKLNIKQISKDFNSLGKIGQDALIGLNKEINSMNTSFVSSNKLLNSIATSFKNTVTWGISSSIWKNMTSSLSNAWSYAKKLDSSLNNIRIVSGQSADQMERFAKQANTAARELGVATTDYTNASLIYYQQGITDPERIKQMTDITVKMANVLKESETEVSNYITSIWNNFEDGTHTLEYYADVITKLGATTASSSEEISQGLEKFSAIAKTVGLSYEYATSALATVTATTRQSADTVGTAFKTLFARIQDLELGDNGAVEIGKYSEALEKFDIHILDTNGEMKKMDAILNEMGSKWKTLSDAQKTALAQAIAGTRQYAQLVALMDNWDFMTKNLETVREATGTLQEQQETYMESIGAHLEQLGAAGERLLSSLFDKDSANGLIDSLSSVVNLVSNFNESLGGGKNVLLTLGSVATQVLSNQISKGLSDIIINSKKVKAELKGIGTALKANIKPDTITGKAQSELYDALLEAGKFASFDEQKELEKIFNDHIENIQKIENEYKGFEETIQGAFSKLKNFWNEATMSETYDPEERDRTVKELENLDFSKGIQSNDDLYIFNSIVEDASNKVTDLQGRLVTLFEQYMDLKQKTDREFLENKTKEEDEKTKKNFIDKASDYIAQMDAAESQIETVTGEKIKSVETLVENFYDAIADPFHIKGSNKDGSKKKKVLEIKDVIGGTGKGGISLPKIKKEIESFKKADNYFTKIKDSIDSRNKKNLEGEYEYVKNQEELQKRIEQNIQIAKQNLEKYSMAGAINEFVNLASSIGQVASALSTLKNIGNIFSNENLTITEKIFQLFSAIGTSTAMLINGITLLKKSFSGAGEVIQGYVKKVIVMGLEEKRSAAEAIKTATEKIVSNELEGKSEENVAKKKLKNAAAGKIKTVEQAQEMAANGTLMTSNISLGLSFKVLGKQMLMAMTPIMPYIAAIAAIGTAIAAVVVISETWETENEKIHNDIKRTENALQKATDAYKELNSSIDNYNNAIDAINGLTEGTVEFYEAIVKANDAAKELIETYGLIAEQDYSMDKNGKIIINQRTQDRLTDQAQRKYHQANADYYYAKANSNEYEINQAYDKTRNTVNQEMFEEQREYYKKQNSSANKEYLQIKNNKNNDDKTIRSFEKEMSVALKNSDLKDLVKGQDLQNKELQLQTSYACKTETNTGEIKNLPDDMSVSITKEMSELISTVNQKQSEYDNNMRIAIAETFRARETDFNIAKFESFSDRQQNLIIDFLAKNGEQYIKQGKAYEKSQMYTNLPEGGGLWKWLWKKFTPQGKEAVDATKEEYLAKRKGWKKDENGNIIDTKNNISISKDAYNKAKSKVDFDEAAKYLTDLQTKNSITGVLTSADLIQDISQKQNNLKKDKNFSGNQANIITEAYTAFRTNQLDTYNEIIKTMAQNELDALAEFTGKSETQVEGYDKQRAKDDLEKYNSEIEKQANQLGVTSLALDMYARASKNADQDTSNLTEDTAKSYAEEMKFNKALQESRKAYSSNEDAFKSYLKAVQKGKKPSAEAAEGAAAVVESLKDMGLALSGDDLTDVSVLKNIQKLLNGTKKEAEDAFNALQEHAWADAVRDNFELINNSAKDTEDAIQDVIDKLSDLEDGDPTTLGDLGLKEVSGTADEIKAKLASLNLSIDEASLNEARNKALGLVDSVTEDIAKANGITATAVEGPTTVTHHKVSGEDKDNNPFEYTYNDVSTPKDVKFTVGKTANLTYKTTKKNFSSGVGASSKKGSTKNTSKIEAEKDLYEKVNVQLGKTAKALSKIQGQTERLTGLDLVKNLVSQTKLLNKEIGYTNDKLKIMYGEQSDLQKKLSSTYGAKFDSEGVLTNYSNIFDKELARANKVLTNKKSTDKQREAAQKRWDNFQKWYQRYDTLVSSEIPDQLQKIQDDLYKQIDNKIKALNLELEVKVDIKDFEETFNEFYAKVLNPNGYKKGSAISVLEQTVRDLDTLFNSGVLGAGSTKLDQVLNNPNVFTSSDAKSGQSVTDDAGRLEQLRSVLTDLMSNTGNLEDFITKVGEGYRDVMSEVSSEMEDQLQIFEQMATAIDQEMNRIKLIEGDFLASTDLKNYFAKKEESLRNRVAVEEQQLTVLAADYERTQTELANAVATWEASKTDKNPNGNLELQYIMEEAQKTADAAWDAYFEKMAQLATDYESLVNIVKESAINAVNSVYTELYKKASDYSYDYLNQEWELLNSNADMYLDSINRAYEIQKIANKYNEAIDIYQGNISAQKKFNELKEKELEFLRNAEYLSEHDIELAEKKYEIAVKQMELEEAKQNKSNLRLRRDSQGNYTYQYGADQDNIAKLQNELEDLYNSLYNFQNDFDRQINEQALRYLEERRRLEAEAMSIVDDEERQKRLELIEKETNEKMAILYAQRARTRTELEKIALSDTIFYYSQNEDAYKDMTEEQRIALETLLKDGEDGVNRAFENLYAHYDEATGEKATDALKSFSTRVSSISDDFITSMFTMSDNGQIASEQITKSITNISDNMSAALYGDGENDKGILGGWENLGDIMIEKADEIEESQTKMTDALITGWTDATIAASGYFDKLIQMFNNPEVQKIIAELKDSIITGSNTYIDDQNKNGNEVQTGLGDIIDTEKNTGGDGGGNNPSQSDEGGSQNFEETWPYGKASATSGLLKVGSRGTGVKAVQYALNKLGFGNTGTRSEDGIFGSNTAAAVKHFQKWVKLSADGIVGNNTKKKFAAKGYDTGGYTGSWGPEGKLAFLHQKELVLNAKDTENILSAVWALRLMNQAMLNQLSAGNIPVGGNGLEQNVHIEANFPNVTNHNEIEEALRNLVNAASQRTTK